MITKLNLYEKIVYTPHSEYENKWLELSDILEDDIIDWINNSENVREVLRSVYYEYFCYKNCLDLDIYDYLVEYLPDYDIVKNVRYCCVSNVGFVKFLNKTKKTDNVYIENDNLFIPNELRYYIKKNNSTISSVLLNDNFFICYLDDYTYFKEYLKLIYDMNEHFVLNKKFDEIAEFSYEIKFIHDNKI